MSRREEMKEFIGSAARELLAEGEAFIVYKGQTDLESIVVSKEDIDDIVAGALEGGITYWCRAAKVVGGKYFGEYASDQIALGGSLNLYDNESGKVYELTLEKTLGGFVQALEEGYGDSWILKGKIDKVNAGMIDGMAADIIIQLALFEEVIYG